MSEFDTHWEFAADEIPRGKVDAAERFLEPLLRDDRVHGRVLDAGCGDGVHATVLEARAPGGERRVGLDVSRRALERAQAHVGGRWEFVQGSLDALPFDDESFDAAYAYGVVAYTADPARSVAELARVTRRDGLVGVWIAPHRGGVAGSALSLVRWLCRVGGPRVTFVVATALVPFLGLMPTASNVSVRSGGWRAAREVVLVNIAPRRLVFPTPSEARDWVSAAGLRIVHDDAASPISLWAVRG